MKKIKLVCDDGDYYLDGVRLMPGESQKVCNHSPDGFNHGYGGSGPAQLALAILLAIFGAEIAKQHYQDFKWKEIATLPDGSFEKEITINL